MTAAAVSDEYPSLVTTAEIDGEPGVPAQPTPTTGSDNPLDKPLPGPLASCPANPVVPAAAEAKPTDDLVGAADAC